jgi:large subunit ribosomal protein L10
MTRNEKQEIINTLTEEFKVANCVVMSDFKGLTVSDLEALRKSARAKEVKVQVIKNSLATISLKNAELEGIELTNTNIFVWGEDSVATSKVVSDFAKANETFTIKNAYVDNEASDVATVEAFAKLPGREELLGMLAATWMAPVANFTIGLEALRAKKEEESA